MSELFPQKTDTLTSRNVVDAYIAAYEAIHATKPECQFIEGRTFLVEGAKRDRHWLVLEIERLRQVALTNAMNTKLDEKSDIFRSIRRLARL